MKKILLLGIGVYIGHKITDKLYTMLLLSNLY